MKNEDLVDKEFDPFIDKSKKKKTKTKKIKISNNSNKSKKVKIKKKIDKLDIILIIVFLLMFSLTAFLGYRVYSIKKGNGTSIKSDIVIPVLGPNTNNQISIDIANMKKNDEREYSFKIVNSKDNDINEDEVSYAIQLVGTENVSIEAYKNGTDKLSIVDNIISGNKLKGKEEQTDVYTFKIKAKKKTANKSLVTVRIIS